MTKLQYEQRIMIALFERHGVLQHPEVQAQSQKVDKLVVHEQRQRLNEWKAVG